ncbi:MAG: TRAP transporter small permease subunit [Desulfobacteraceae bacterium]|nr:TRAP transporter small permease subunit [Desulfobacteraceae bacterium]
MGTQAEISAPVDAKAKTTPSASLSGIDRVVNVIDQISIWTGKAAGWLIVPLALVLAYEVFIRKFFQPTIWAHDWATQFYGVHFMVAGAWTLYLGKHIRTDLFYDKWSPKTQATVDAILYIFLFMPGMLMFLWLATEYASESWELKERLLTPGRPPAYYYKTFLPVSVALLILQGVSETIKCIKVVRGGKK